MESNEFLVSRRTALKGAASLIIACFTDRTIGALTEVPTSSADHPLNAWLRISTNNRVTIVVSQAEMGQGIMTTLPAVIAEELGADWNAVELEMSPAAVAYRNPRINWQFTGNSESTMSFFDLMRQVGASAREMLVNTAARRWRIAPSRCCAENSFVIDMNSGRKFSFGELAAEASHASVPAKAALTAEAKWKLLGKPIPRVDIPSKCEGSAIFGMDVNIPGMVFAAIRNCPFYGGKLRRFDAASVQGIEGISGVWEVPGGVAVVGSSYWHAKKAVEQLDVEWDEGPDRFDSNTIMEQYRSEMSGDDWVLVKTVGNPDALPHPYRNTPVTGAPAPPTEPNPIRTDFARFHSAEYQSQFLAHATMEPMNATALVNSDGCEVWAPTQGQEMAQMATAQLLGLDKSKVQIHRTYLGGGFGRRLVADYILQAVALARQCGKPVKAIWSREEDMQHDLYRPAVLHQITAGTGEDGTPLALSHRVVSPSMLQFVYSTAVTDKLDPMCLEGLLENDYSIPNQRIDFHLLKVPVPTSVLRTTGYGPNLFALESFLDEEAHLAGKDPYLFRRDLLRGKTRALAVLDLAAEKSGWTKPPAAGVFRGIAFAHAFETLIGQVVEISVSNRVITVHRVVSAVDCGTVLNSNISASNIEGGIAWGLSVAFRSEITFDGGRAAQSNFHDYQVLRLPEMPACETYFINSGARPLGGTGEIGPVAVVPALTNALFAATGIRIRSLPLARHGFNTNWRH